MLVYGHRSFPVHLPAFLAQFERRVAALPSAPAHDTLVDLLVDLAEVESAVTDALTPAEDDEHADVAAWRASLGALADAFCASYAEDRVDLARHVDRFRRSVARLPTGIADGHVQARSAEGFSIYALYPEQYVDAARDLHRLIEPAAPIVCIGLRSIGSALAAIVGAELARAGHAVETRSVRPRGHPFDRRVVMGQRLTALVDARRAHEFVVVDEGPGISGSSFASAADMLRSRDVPAGRISLIAAWMPDPHGLRSERGRQVFTSHRVVVGRSPVSALAREALGGEATDISAGQWRPIVLGPGATRWPAVHPQHERVKFVDSPIDPRTVVRFAGLGKHGHAKRQRALLLHEAGFGAEPAAFHRGLLPLAWLRGSPLRARDRLTRASIQHIADYLALLNRAFALPEADDGRDLIEMLRHNSRSALSDADASVLESLTDARWATAPRVAVDGRMLRQEWICDGTSLTKVDALDHHADDFLPGCRDIAWDVAGAGIDLRLEPVAQQELVAAYVAASGDAQVVERLPFFRAAYLSYRLGYTAMAAEALGGTPDGERFTRARERYRRLLAAHAVHLRQSAGR